MLPHAPAEQAKRWASVPQDGCWYSVQPPAFAPDDPFDGPSGWPNLASGSRHWKASMTETATMFSNLVRAFGVEPHCTICSAGSTASAFDAHTTSPQHFRVVSETVEAQFEMAREELWHETIVVGGRVRYNHLDGEMQVLREVPEEQEYSDTVALQALPYDGVWLLGSGPACVAAHPAGLRLHWPNLWSWKNWKEKMERATRRVSEVVEANGDINGCRCMLCPDRTISPEHMLGKKHFTELAGRVPDGAVLRLEDFWQTWTFPTGAVAFNHIDGTVRVVKRPLGAEDASAIEAASAASQSRARRTQVKAEPAPAAKPQQPPPPAGSPLGPFTTWLWQRHAAVEAKRLEAALDAVAIPRAGLHCALCGLDVGPAGLAAHLVEPWHVWQVQQCFEQQGPDAAVWTQRWGGLQLNHLTLDVITDGAALAAASAKASEPASEAAGPMLAEKAPLEVPAGAESAGWACEEAPAKTRPQAPEMEEKKGAGTAPAPNCWQAFEDPVTRTTWYYNSATGEASWVPPPSAEADTARKSAALAAGHRPNGDEAAGAGAGWV